MESHIIQSLFSLLFLSSFDISCGHSGSSSSDPTDLQRVPNPNESSSSSSSSDSIDLNRVPNPNEMDPLDIMNSSELFNFRFPSDSENPWPNLRSRLKKHPEKHDQLWKHLCLYLWPKRIMFNAYEMTCSYIIQINSMGVFLEIYGEYKRIRTDFVKCICMYFDPISGYSMHDINHDDFHVAQYNSTVYFRLKQVGNRNLKLKSIECYVPPYYDDADFIIGNYNLPKLRN